MCLRSCAGCVRARCVLVLFTIHVLALALACSCFVCPDVSWNDLSCLVRFVLVCYVCIAVCRAVLACVFVLCCLVLVCCVCSCSVLVRVVFFLRLVRHGHLFLILCCFVLSRVVTCCCCASELGCAVLCCGLRCCVLCRVILFLFVSFRCVNRRFVVPCFVFGLICFVW